jgi:hypothetical protein
VLSANATATATVGVTVQPASGLGYSCIYGNKLTQVSLDPGFYGYPRGNMGARSSGVPCFYGIATIAELQAAVVGSSNTPIPHALVMELPSTEPYTYAWPAQRTDGSTAHHIKTGHWVRIQQTPAATAAIAALPSKLGRVLATALQNNGGVILDTTGYNVVLQAEDLTQFDVVNGWNPYADDSDGVVGAGGILGGLNPYNTGVLQNFPWAYLEVLDANHANPAWAGQPLLSAPTITGHQKLSDHVIVGWQDQVLASYYNVYSVSAGPVYTLIAQSDFPQYSLWSPTGSQTTFVVTAVNGGGESARSQAVTPGSSMVALETSLSSDVITRPLPAVRAAVKRKLRVSA